MSFHFILLFSATVFVASIIPGPSMLLALTHGMRYGVKRTLASAMGNVTVTLLQASISIAGVGTILIASESVFQLIKWAGTAYLMYMGISILCSSKDFLSGTDSKEIPEQTQSLGKMYLQASLVTAGNPKAILFFTAVFPQFIDNDAAFLSQLFILLIICALVTFTCFMMYASCGQKLVTLFSGASIGRYVKKVIGTAFIGAGISLAMSKR